MRASRCLKLFSGFAAGAAMAVAGLAQAQSVVSAAPPRITAPVDNASRVTLKGAVPPLANANNDTGAASPDLWLGQVQLVLRKSPSQQAALQQLVKEQQTPGSPNYHKWLTPAEFGQKFGPNPEDIEAIESWVQSQGFTVNQVNPGHGSLVISGTAGQVERAFHTSIHRYMVAGQYHYSNATNPQIPAALAPVLGGFVSLNNFPVHRLSHYLGKASYDPSTGKATPEWTTSSNGPLGYDLVMSPADFAVEYDLNPLYQAGTNGSGQTIAIVNDSNINIAVVNNFRSLFGLPANPPHVIVAGTDPGIDGVNNYDGRNFDSVEAYLDVEWAGAVAPNATIDLVIAGDTAVQNGLILAMERAVFSDIAPVMSVSFGACEQSLGSYNQFLNSLWQQAAAEGITVLVATGDSGSAGDDPRGQVCDSPDSPAASFGLAVNGYASTPYDVAVGGTDFYYSDYNNSSSISGQLKNYWNTTPSPNPQVSIKGYIPEQPWNDTALGLNIFQQSSPEIVGGGGGPSTCGIYKTDSNGNFVSCSPYTKPSWQTGPGVPSTNARYIPDVSLFAADGINDSYYPVCGVDGDCQPGASPVQISGVGGTSGAAPAMAGIMALVNQKYGPQGQADFVLYPLAQQHPSAFHDITVGTNAMPCVAGKPNCSSGKLAGFSATSGYDPATGLGSIDANALVSNWNSISFTSTSTTLSLSSSSFTHGTPVTLNTGVSGSGGTPTGSVAIMTDNPTLDQQGMTSLALSGGQASGSINFLPGGTYNVWAQYAGDGKFGGSTSPKVQVTVSPESSSIIYSAVVSSQGQFQQVNGSQLPYGTQVIFDADVVPTSFYNKCNQGQSNSSSCQNAAFGSATGTVVFSNSSSKLNTALINSEGDAEYITGALPVGKYSVSASYSGDLSYNASSASAVSFSVAQATPTITVTSNASSIASGQDLVLTAVVDSNGSGVAPTGSVTFKNGSTTLGSAPLVASTNPQTGTVTGVATLPIKAPTASSSKNRSPFGWLFGAGGGGLAVASVFFFGVPRRRRWHSFFALVAIAILVVGVGCGGGGNGGGNGGGGVPPTPPPPSGPSLSVVASYGGDSNYSSATSSALAVSLTGASSLLTSTVSAAAKPSSTTSPASAITLNVTVTGQNGKAAPTGTVNLLIPGYNTQSASLKPSSGDSSTISFLPLNSQGLAQGATVITFQYSGDSTYQPSSTTITLNNPLADFAMAARTPVVSLNGGGSTSATIDFSSINGFNGAIALTCAGSAGASCTANPGTVNLNGQASATVSISAPNSSTILVTGTSGAITHNVSVIVK